MIQKLSKHGDGLALVIDSSLLDQLKIDENTALEIRAEGDTLIVAPIRDQQHARKFEQTLSDVNARFSNALKRLAE